MGCKFGEALARLKARHMMRSLPLQGAGVGVSGVGSSAAAAAGLSAGTDSPVQRSSTFTDDDFTTYV